MKNLSICSGNVYNGGVGDLVGFIEDQSLLADLVLLQEVPSFSRLHQVNGHIDNYQIDLYQRLANRLSSFKGYFANRQTFYVGSGGDQVSIDWGLASFVREHEIGKVRYQDPYIWRQPSGSSFPGSVAASARLQILEFEFQGETITVANLHGLHLGSGYGKGDTPERDVQAGALINALKGKENIILMGDFNLNPDTRALQRIESELNLVNLIKRDRVKQMRTKIYPKRDASPFASYAMVSHSLPGAELFVIDNQVSDHKFMRVSIDL